MFLVQSRNKNFGIKMPFHLPGAYYIFQLGCFCFSSRKMRPRQPKEASTGSQAYKDKLGEHFLPEKKLHLSWPEEYNHRRMFVFLSLSPLFCLSFFYLCLLPCFLCLSCGHPFFWFTWLCLPSASLDFLVVLPVVDLCFLCCAGWRLLQLASALASGYL